MTDNGGYRAAEPSDTDVLSSEIQPEKSKKRCGIRRAAGIALLLCCCILISSVSGGVSAYIVCSFFPLNSKTDSINETAVPTQASQVIVSSSETLPVIPPPDTQPIHEQTQVRPVTEAPVLTEAQTSQPQTAGPTASTIYSENVNSVVGISAYTTKVINGLFGLKTSKEIVSNGSGFFVTPDGYILTNNHVAQGAHTYKISLYDGSVLDAVFVGSVPANDMALLKVNGNDFRSVELGDSSDITVGDNVLIIGNALGELTFTLTSGVVSFLNRSVSVDSHTMNMCQTDAPINVGNSGGPVFDMNGRVIGMASAKMASESIEGLGFFIPIDDIKMKVIDLIAKNG